MSVQIITKEGKPEYAVLPYGEYQRLLELAEETADVRAYDAALASDEETIPHEMVGRLVRGENPIRVWREHRMLTQAELAGRAGLEVPVIAMLEIDLASGGPEVLAKIAGALGVDLDDLI